MAQNKNSYPYWYCPVWFCPYRTHYVKNIGIHLSKVHDWREEAIRAEKELFWDAKNSNKDFICDKPRFDPTKTKNSIK